MLQTLRLLHNSVVNATSGSTPSLPLRRGIVEFISWGVAAPAIGAAFLASLVEVVEAFTIVLAVGTLRSWRPAALGTVTALGALGLLIAVLGPLLGSLP